MRCWHGTAFSPQATRPITGSTRLWPPMHRRRSPRSRRNDFQHGQRNAASHSPKWPSGQSQPGSVRAGEGRHCMLQEHPAGYSAGGSVLATGSVLVRGFVGISRTESRKQKLYCGMAQRQRKRYLSASHFASARKRRKCKVPLSAECRVPLRMAQGKRRTCGRAAGEYLGTTV